MASKIKVKLILELRDAQMSRNFIADSRGMSRNSVSDVFHIANKLSVTFKDVQKMDADEVYRLFYPEKHAEETMYTLPDYEDVHRELKRTGVTLKLLWKEYQTRCATSSGIPMGYTKFCEGYKAHTVSNKLTNHLLHKPGVAVEVDWSGPTMSFVDRTTGEVITVYLFVAVLPFSQYAYVEPRLDMKEDSWLKCHIHMFEFFQGIPIRTVCDNLKTGVIKHPKEGDIVLNDSYEALGQHYMTAIMPAMVRKPKQKASVEGTVGKIATAIIAKLRNEHFNTFSDLTDGVSEALAKFNQAPFQKREGSRLKIYLEEERQHLHELPVIPYEVAEWLYDRSVNIDCHVIVAKNRYSCPYQYVGKLVDIKVTEKMVEVYYRHNRIATHPKYPSYVTNQYSTHGEDMPDRFKQPEWDDVRIRSWAHSIGESTGAVVDLIFSSVKIKEQGYNPSLSVLRLSKTYSEARLETACELALTKVRTPRYHHLKSILAANQDQIHLGNKTAGSGEAKATGGYVRGPEYYGGGRNDQ